MELSHTSDADSWLQQFDSGDRAVASDLLDSIRFARVDKVIIGVRKWIEQFMRENPSRRPVVLVPIMSLEDMELIGEADPAEPVVFDNFDPEQLIENEPGSEAPMSQLIGEVRKGSYSKFLVPAPYTLHNLKGAKTRTLLCITDYIGSGRQVLRYVETWHRHATIRSWRSFGWLKIVVIAYAATLPGKSTVMSSPYVDELLVEEIVPGISGFNPYDPQGKFEELCNRYAQRHGLNNALGYKNSAGLFASSISVPNNLPAILIDKSSSSWLPFFDGRSVPAVLAQEIDDHQPVFINPSRLEDSWKKRFDDGHNWPREDRPWQKYQSVLEHMPLNGNDLSLGLGISLPEAERMLITLMRLELIDSRHKLTCKGRETLKSKRRKIRRVAASLEPDPSSYYPKYSR